MSGMLPDSELVSAAGCERKDGCHSCSSFTWEGRSMGQEMLGSPGIGCMLVVLVVEVILTLTWRLAVGS